MTGTRSYFDHASLSPLRPEGLEALSVALRDLGGDPGRQHTEGMQARVALEVAREQVAALVGARSREVVFTASATEAIAAVCWGIAAKGGAQVLSAAEHSAVRTAAMRTGAAVVVGVDGLGRIDLDQLAATIDDTTSAVHVQWSNHEVGTTQPIAAVVELCRPLGILVHVDAAQGVGHDPIDFAGLGIDLLSLSGPKFGGPSGTGALIVRRGLRLAPLLVGGDQERARRAGLENVPACVALGVVADRLTQPGVLARERTVARAQTKRLAEALCSIPDVIALGDRDTCAPHLLCLSIVDVEPQAVILGLDRAGIAAHSGSACATESLEPSPVLEAMGIDAAHSLRLSVGWSTTENDVDRVIETLPRVLEKLRALRG